MNKALLVLLSVLLISSFGTYKALSEISSHRNDVEFSQRNIYGDSSVLNGLELHFDILGYHKNLVWENDIRFTQNGFVSKSEVQPANKTKHRHYKDKVTLNLMNNISRDDAELASVMKEITHDCVNGQEYEKTIYIKDYYEYYPLWCFFSVNDEELIRKYGQSVFYDNNDNNTGLYSIESYNGRKLTEFLKIGIPENETISIDVINHGISFGSSIGYPVETMSTCSDNMIYFYVNNRCTDGSTVEFGRGYGIFRIPYGNVEQNNYKGVYKYSGIDIDTDNIDLFYSMDENEMVKALSYDEAGRKLVLVTEKEDETWLKVISDEGDLLQQLSVGEAGDKTDIYMQDDYLVINEKGSYLKLYQLCNGNYELKINTYSTVMDNACDESGTHNNFDLSIMRSKYYYDGKYLTVVKTHNYRSFILLGVYDNEKLLYAGWYDCNLRGGINWPDDTRINWK